MQFEQYLKKFLTDSQIQYMKEALLNHRDVCFYGVEGNGKYTLWVQFYNCGFMQVSEVGELAEIGTEGHTGTFNIPQERVHNVVMIEPYGMGSEEPFPREHFSKRDINEWLYGGGGAEGKNHTTEMLELLYCQVKLLCGWDAGHINDDCIEQVRKNVETEYKITNYLASFTNEKTAWR